ncbi:hypothetical protein ATI61_11766 [Archangium gephyra]|uniref:Uncharacterized protein n=1 Tax=Archangium gephyra TaxID=48 RepID=A0AAC8Q8S3_9BACT|nr:hypothetical protein [Archangium gephyra]AKJ02678.1 Hypothetical protein AA314_04304 [Archangium gephyra]REG23223.1 hypothetical protein ATI61_11766 [Archangium gephyra]
MKTHTPRPQLRRRHRRGQAMVEYSFINWALVLALIVMMSVDFGSGDQEMNVIDAFLRAYQIYYDSFYFVLNLPFP